jgi:hypothetical protein
MADLQVTIQESIVLPNGNREQLSNTKKLSFSQIDCQDINQSQEFLT